jgi:RHS repeat-associated protein
MTTATRPRSRRSLSVRQAGDHPCHARRYDPSKGVFITRNPLGYAGGDANLYRYVHNDPIDRTDPSGLEDSGPNTIKIVNPGNVVEPDLPEIKGGSFKQAGISGWRAFEYILETSSNTILYLGHCNIDNKGPGDKLSFSDKWMNQDEIVAASKKGKSRFIILGACGSEKMAKYLSEKNANLQVVVGTSAEIKPRQLNPILRLFIQFLNDGETIRNAAMKAKTSLVAGDAGPDVPFLKVYGPGVNRTFQYIIETKTEAK